jgi:hypothetical protein
MAARADVPRALLRWGLGEIRGLTFCGRRLRFRSDVSSRQALGLRLLKTRGRQEKHPNWPMLRSRRAGTDRIIHHWRTSRREPSRPHVRKCSEQHFGRTGNWKRTPARSGIMVDAAEDLQELEYFHSKSRAMTSPSRKGTVRELLKVTESSRNFADYYRVHGRVVDDQPCAPLHTSNAGRSEIASRVDLPPFFALVVQPQR